MEKPRTLQWQGSAPALQGALGMLLETSASLDQPPNSLSRNSDVLTALLRGSDGDPRALAPVYKGHVPGLDYSFGSTYGNATLKYFQDHRNAALENSHTPLSKGGHFPTIYSPNPDLVLCNRSQARARWLHRPSYTRFNLDSDRSTELYRFYQMAQEHRQHYRDKTDTVPRVPYFVLPVKERERYPIPTDLPPLSPKDKWHLLRLSPDNLKTYQTFPSGKRVSSQERQKRDSYFEFRA